MTIVLPRISSFESWIAEADRYGLVIERWIINDQAGELKLTAVIHSLSGEPIQFEDEVQNSMAKKKPDPTDDEKPHRSKLSDVLTELHASAVRNLGKPQRMELPGGLRVDCIVGIDGNTRILLAREGVYPSDTEFTTILAHWPYDPPDVAPPERFEHKAWCCLRAAWPTPIKNNSTHTGTFSEEENHATSTVL